MNGKIIWVIGKDCFAPYIIYYLNENPDIQVASTHREYTNNDVQIISTCESLDIEPDAIVLLNFRFGYVNGTTLLNNEFFKAHKCPYYVFAHTAYTRRLEKRLGLVFKTFRASAIGREVFNEAIGYLIIKALIENHQLLLKDLSIEIIEGQPISSYFKTLFNRLIPTTKVVAIEEVSDGVKVIIIPSGVLVEQVLINKWSFNNTLVIKLWEDNSSFSVINKGRIQRIYTLRSTNYGVQSYAKAFSEFIEQEIKGG